MKKVTLILAAAMLSTVMFAQTPDTKKTEQKKEPAKTETVKPADTKATTAPASKTTTTPAKKKSSKPKTETAPAPKK
jgi:hypothetical protein